MFKQHWSRRSKQNTHHVFWRHQGINYLNSSRTRSIGPTPNNCSIGKCQFRLAHLDPHITASGANHLKQSSTDCFCAQFLDSPRQTVHSHTARSALYQNTAMYPKMSRLQTINKIFRAFQRSFTYFYSFGPSTKILCH